MTEMNQPIEETTPSGNPKNPFSFEGRVRRTTYWITYIICNFIGYILGEAAGNGFEEGGLLQFLYFLPALLLSLSIHEFGHAWVAYKLGDNSQKARGRLTLSPFAHIDPIGFAAIALMQFSIALY